jgi:hypothetical protein
MTEKKPAIPNSDAEKGPDRIADPKKGIERTKTLLRGLLTSDKSPEGKESARDD